MAEAAHTAHERLGVPAGSHLMTPGVQVGQDLTTHLTATQRQGYGRASSATGHTYDDVHEIYAGAVLRLSSRPSTPCTCLATIPHWPMIPE
jgi:hypothetical protein